MGERDAFGREKDEDTLADMGWRPDGPAAWESAPVTKGDPLAVPTPFDAGDATGPFARPAPRPAEPESVFAAGEATKPFARPTPPPAEPVVAAPARPPEPPPSGPTFTPPRRRRRRGGFGMARLIILAAVVGAAFIGFNKANDVTRDVTGDIRGKIDDALDDITTAVPTTTPAQEGKPQSLFRTAGLRAALAKLPDGRLVFLRVAADRIDAQIVSGDTRHIVQVRADGSTIKVRAPAGPRQPALSASAAAPLRVIRTATRRAGRSASSVDYVVGTSDGWQLFFKDGVHYSADPSGRKVAKV